MTFRCAPLVLAAVATLSASTAIAQNPSQGQGQSRNQNQGPEIITMDDRTWISVSGTVTDTTEDSFRLDYGEGTLGVEMDDWDWYREAFTLVEGDEITVYGYLDDDLFQNTSMEATSMFVKGLNSYFYASGGDDARTTYISWVPTVATIINGTVKSIGQGQLTLSTGQRTLTVSTDELGYDPFDKDGYQKIKVGDRVAITGDIEKDFFEEREFKANTITTLSADGTQRKGQMKQKQGDGMQQQNRMPQQQENRR